MSFYILRTLCIIWLLPATILVWLFYILPVWLIWKDLEWIGWAEYGIAEFALAKTGLERWHVRLWRDWGGWSGPCVFISKKYELSPASYDRTKKHELRHCVQQLILGIFHYPLYLVESILIWFFYPHLHAYLDNSFERDARSAAGQPVDIDPSNWPQGPYDRWPWW